jgi:hypothetical protein
MGEAFGNGCMSSSFSCRSSRFSLIAAKSTRSFHELYPLAKTALIHHLSRA